MAHVETEVHPTSFLVSLPIDAQGLLRIVKALVECIDTEHRAALLQAGDDQFSTPLYYASRCLTDSSLDVLKYLITLPEGKRLCEAVNDRMDTPLHAAAETGECAFCRSTRSVATSSHQHAMCLPRFVLYLIIGSSAKIS